MKRFLLLLTLFASCAIASAQSFPNAENVCLGTLGDTGIKRYSAGVIGVSTCDYASGKTASGKLQSTTLGILSAAAPASPLAGDIWNDSTKGGLTTATVAGSSESISRSLGAYQGVAAVSNVSFLNSPRQMLAI